jgi:hypothetical protein
MSNSKHAPFPSRSVKSGLLRGLAVSVVTCWLHVLATSLSQLVSVSDRAVFFPLSLLPVLRHQRVLMRTPYHEDFLIVFVVIVVNIITERNGNSFRPTARTGLTRSACAPERERVTA